MGVKYHKSTDKIERIIALQSSGWAVRPLAKLFDMSCDTFCRLKNEYNSKAHNKFKANSNVFLISSNDKVISEVRDFDINSDHMLTIEKIIAMHEAGINLGDVLKAFGVAPSTYYQAKKLYINAVEDTLLKKPLRYSKAKLERTLEIEMALIEDEDGFVEDQSIDEANQIILEQNEINLIDGASNLLQAKAKGYIESIKANEKKVSDLLLKIKGVESRKLALKEKIADLKSVQKMCQQLL